MTISDIITIISLVIAIVAIISEKNRKHLILKFGYFDFGVYVFAFLLINYFVFYNQFYSKGYFLNCLYFQDFGLKNPSNYSYLISIIVLISVLYKIWYSFYPNRKKSQVLKYYRSLIENNEIPMLLDMIEKYHLEDIRNLIKTSKSCDTESKDSGFERYRKIPTKEKILLKLKLAWQNINLYSKLNRYSYASYVLHDTINDPAFLILASNVRPYLFANIFCTFKKEKRNIFPEDLVNQFLTELIKSKNFWLIKELKQSDNFDKGQPSSFYDENKIIASLIHDVSVAHVNEIWKPFGEEAIKEIENENNIGIESRLYQQYRNDDLLWDYKVFISIEFFNILIIESIVKKYSGTHFFLHYYFYITESILKNFLKTPPNDFEEIDSNYHFLIKKMNVNLVHWLTLANKYENDRFYDIIRCIGNQINCITKNPYFGEKRKLNFIGSILNYYCNIEEKAKTSVIRDELDKILNKPSIQTQSTDSYYYYIEAVWNSFDKIPHRNDLESYDYDYFARLKQNVIIPLGLNPDE